MATTTAESHFLPEKSYPTDTASVNTSFSYPEKASQGTRLEIKYKDVLARHGQISDPITGELLYTTHHTYRSPTFTLFDASETTTLITATSHTWTMKFDVEVPATGAAFELTPRKKLGRDITYASPAFGGQTMTWDYQHTWNRIEYVLLDGEAMPVARFKGGSCWKCVPWGTFGEFEFVEGKVEGEEQRREVVATGLALAYKAYMNKNSGATAAVVTS